MGPDALIGTWRLVSWHVIVDGQPQDLFGEHPRGFLILTAEGRAMVLTTAEHRRAGESTA
ncbi:MAG: lipocalin-like domain-containing protein, partial [Thermomicrobiales bacterium]